MENNTKKLTKLDMFGYGLGGLGEGTAYNLYYAFFIYFVTTVAGLSAAAAGTISLFAVIWDAITDPLVGQLSDTSNNPKGRRVPFLFRFAVPLGLTVLALFLCPNVPDGVLVAYYAVINIAFWLFFTCCDIPWISLGAEIATDYNERTQIRVWSQVGLGLGGMLALSGTLLLVEKFAKVMGSEKAGWVVTAVVFAIVSAVSFLLVAIFMKKVEPKNECNHSRENLIRAFKGLGSALRLKQYRVVIALAFLGNAIMGVGQSTTIFVQSYIYNLDAGGIAIVNAVGPVCNILMALIIGAFGRKMEKRTIAAISMILPIIGFGIIYVAPHTLPMAVLSQSIVYAGYGAFWTIIYSLNYDIVEIDEFKHGEKREGLIVSFNSFAMKLGISVGMWVVGNVLTMVGFDDMVAKGAVLQLDGLYLAAVAMPVICSVLGLLALIGYKVNQKNFEALQDALSKKSAGEAYSDEGFSELL